MTGGETFLRDDIFEIAYLWYKNTALDSLSITSNGSMPEKIEKFCKQARCNSLPVFFFLSYDFIEEKHSEYRNLKKLHINVVESYKIIKKYGFNTTFQLTLSPLTIDSAFDTYCYMRDVLKVQNINCNLLRGHKTIDISFEEKQKIATVYEKIQRQMDVDYTSNILQGFNDDFVLNNILNAKNRIIWKYLLKIFKDTKFICPCVAGSLMGVIYSDGSVFPCELLSDSFGNLKDYDFNFQKCWESRTAKKLKKCILEQKCL